VVVSCEEGGNAGVNEATGVRANQGHDDCYAAGAEAGYKATGVHHWEAAVAECLDVVRGLQCRG